MVYSQANTVSLFTRHYQFLTSLPHLSHDDLLLPPPEGWPEITTDSLSRLNKNDDVINLLKHMPYIRNNAGHGHFAQDVEVIDYPFWVQVFSHESTKKPPAQGHVVIEEALPPHVVVLTRGDNYSGHVLLDTKRGTVTDWSMYRSITHPETGAEMTDDTESWRHHPTLPIEEFLADREQKFQSLTWVARIGGLARGIESQRPQPYSSDDDDHNRHLDLLAQVHRVFGWPDLTTFDREGCRSVIVELEERRKEAYFRDHDVFRDLRKMKGPPLSEAHQERFDWALRTVRETAEEEKRVRAAEIEETRRREEAEDAADGDYVPGEEGGSGSCSGSLECCDDDDNNDVPAGWVEVIDDDDYYEYAELDHDRDDIDADMQFLTQARDAGQVTSLFEVRATQYTESLVYREKQSSA